MKPSWTLVKAVLAEEPEDWSVWHDVFERHGASGSVQAESPWSIGAYLADPAQASLAALQAEITRRGATVACETVEEEDWAEAWKQFFKPRRVGRFLIKPTWEPCETCGDELLIELDPGQAFGTGDHPTTRMCLELLAKESSRSRATVADIGCGSGILSIAAALSGAEIVDAVDQDPVSVAVARENASRNRVTVRVFEGSGFEPLPDERYGLVLSNIISAALIRLAPHARERTEPGGAWIVSGVITDNWPDVLSAAERSGFRLEDLLSEGEWVAATLRR